MAWRLKDIHIPNPLAGLHEENKHANARNYMRAYLRLRNSPGIGNAQEARQAYTKAQELGLDDSDIAILTEEQQIPIAFR